MSGEAAAVFSVARCVALSEAGLLACEKAINSGIRQIQAALANSRIAITAFEALGISFVTDRWRKLKTSGP